MCRKFRPLNGISVLISAQNEQSTIRMCVESFLEFGDELIIVTNGSTDKTPEICRELETLYPDKVKYYKNDSLIDLSENRQYAYSKSKYKWIFRCDGDYIAYNIEDGRYSITKLRNQLLQMRTLRPVAIWVEQVNINIKWDLTRKPIDSNDESLTKLIGPPLYVGFMPRIYTRNIFFKFVKKGKNEGVNLNRLYKQVFISDPFWFHCTIKSDKDLFLRTERRAWRATNDYIKFPTIEDFFKKKVLKEKYGDSSIEDAISDYRENVINPLLTKYDPLSCYPYPKRIQEIIGKECSSNE